MQDKIGANRNDTDVTNTSSSEIRVLEDALLAYVGGGNGEATMI